MKRFRLDLLLAVLFLLVMGFRVLTPLLHEVLGIVLLAGLALHLWWNRAWFAALGRGKWRRLRVVQAMLVVLLLVSTLTALGTGLIISNHVLRAFWAGSALHSSILVHQLHVASAYFMAIFLGMHIGMYWAGLWARLKTWPVLRTVEAHPSLRFWVLVLIGWAGCAYARLDHFGDRMLMRHVFQTPAGSLPGAAVYLFILCLLGLYAIAFYYLQRRLARPKQPVQLVVEKGGTSS